MNFLHLTVWSSRARLTSDVVLLCKEAPSTVCCANLRASFVFSHQEVQVSILEQIFLGPLSCPRKLRLVQVPIFPPLSKSCSSTQAENTFWKEFNVKIFWSPFHSKSGPHFEQLRSPSHVGAVTLILSVFSYIVFTFLYSYIVVYVHFLPGPMTQGILCQGSLVCCFVKNACQ